MIFIKRPPAPDFLTKPKGRWQDETSRAIEHYKNETVTEPFKFAMYRLRRLKNELKKVFPKCAYCETVYDASSDGDVEHFRPKGKVSDKDPQTPGYYWLANDWDNLMLSCQHCNQRREHQIFGEDALKSYGKLDQFPLRNEKKRVHAPGVSLKAEEKVRLLLNPCKDNPEEHFKYEMTEAVVEPITEMGNLSVKVFALQRLPLVQERKKRLLLLLRQMGIVERELKRFNNDRSASQKAIFQTELDYLIDYTKFDSPYAGMCRYFVKQFFAEHNIVL